MWDIKEPTPMFEKSPGRRPQWCGQPLLTGSRNLVPRAFPHPFFKGKALGTRLGLIVGLGRDGALSGTYESHNAHSVWAGLSPEKLLNLKTKN